MATQKQSKSDETPSSPFVPSSEEEAAEAYGLAATLLRELIKDKEQNPEEWE